MNEAIGASNEQQSVVSGSELAEVVAQQLKTMLSAGSYDSVKMLLQPVQPVDIAEAIGNLPRTLQALLAEVRRLRDAEEVVAAGGRHRSHQEHSYVARSRYELQLARYEKLFPADQMLLLRSEDFFDDPKPVWQRLLNFLDVPTVPVPMLPRANAGRTEAKLLSAELRLQLKDRLRVTYALMEQRYGLVWAS